MRTVTTVAPQALMLLNSSFLDWQAGVFAGRLMAEKGTAAGTFVRRAYQLALSRNPAPPELEKSLAFLKRQEKAFARRRARSTFRPGVPDAIEHGFKNTQKPSNFLEGPAAGWEYFRGRWYDAGDRIDWGDPQRRPFALHETLRFPGGELSTELFMHSNSEGASVYFRGGNKGDLYSGLELLLDPREDRVELRRHGKDLGKVKSAPARLDTGVWYRVRISLEGAELRVWVGLSGSGEKPVLEVSLEKSSEPGDRVGSRLDPPAIVERARRQGGVDVCGRAVSEVPALLAVEFGEDPRERRQGGGERAGGTERVGLPGGNDGGTGISGADRGGSLDSRGPGGSRGGRFEPQPAPGASFVLSRTAKSERVCLY